VGSPPSSLLKDIHLVAGVFRDKCDVFLREQAPYGSSRGHRAASMDVPASVGRGAGLFLIIGFSAQRNPKE
jgi:hypothetical protein